VQNTFYFFLSIAQLSTVLLSCPSTIDCGATTRCNWLLLSSQAQPYKHKPCLHLSSLPLLEISWWQPLPKVARLKTLCTIVTMILTRRSQNLMCVADWPHMSVTGALLSTSKMRV
jgi:hypothetical protein